MLFKMENNISEKISKLVTEPHNIEIHGNIIHVEISQKDKKIFMNINSQDKWENIQSSINAHLQQILTRQCPLCLVKDNARLTRVSCPKCAFHWCNSCYMKMIYKSQKFNVEKRCFYYTKIICPSCNDGCVDKKTCFMEME